MNRRLYVLVIAASVILSCSDEINTEVVWLPGSPTTAIYVDAVDGSDSNQGRSPEYAIKSIAMLNTLEPMIGDTILLRGGQTHSGSIKVENIDATQSHNLYISSYGDGVATIDGGVNYSIATQNSSYIRVVNLYLTDDAYTSTSTLVEMLGIDELTTELSATTSSTAEYINVVDAIIIKR